MIPISTIRRHALIEQMQADGWLRSLEWLDETDSTNRYLRDQLTDQPNLDLPRLVVASRQTAGRGRGENHWWSPEGCLMFSLAWHPAFLGSPPIQDTKREMTQLPLVVGIAIATAVRAQLSHPESIGIKWPNDVYVAGKKLAGILIEHVTRPESPYWIVGVGINVRVDLRHAPPPVQHRATSLHQEASLPMLPAVDEETTLSRVVGSLQEILTQWQTEPLFLATHWPRYCILTHQRVEIEQPHAIIRGICRGIDDSGALLVEDSCGALHAILSGVVRAWSQP